MATNYRLLKQSENELIQKFYDYVDHTFQMHKMVLQILNDFNNQKNFEKLENEIQSIYDAEKIANITQADLLDECTWIISKDQPQASHLRFVIAIINSINDLERICDYANNITKNIYEKKVISPSGLAIVKLLEEMAVNIFEKIFDHFRSHDASETYVLAEKLHSQFMLEYSNQIKILHSIYSSDQNSENNTDFIYIVLTIKNIERILDHVMNIIEYFIYIKESNFFFKKRT